MSDIIVSFTRCVYSQRYFLIFKSILFYLTRILETDHRSFVFQRVNIHRSLFYYKTSSRIQWKLLSLSSFCWQFSCSNIWSEKEKSAQHISHMSQQNLSGTRKIYRYEESFTVSSHRLQSLHYRDSSDFLIAMMKSALCLSWLFESISQSLDMCWITHVFSSTKWE